MKNILSCEQAIFDLAFACIGETAPIAKFDKKVALTHEIGGTYCTVSYTIASGEHVLSYLHTYHSTNRRLGDVWSFTHTKPNGIADVTSDVTPKFEREGTNWAKELKALVQMRQTNFADYTNKLSVLSHDIADRITKIL